MHYRTGTVLLCLTRSFCLTPSSPCTKGTCPLPAASGWCSLCEREHTILRTAAAEAEAQMLLSTVELSGRFDFDSPEPEDRFRVECCTSGKMLGVLVCSDGTVLRGFSGMLGGTWQCPGWVGPVATMTLEDPEASRRFGEIIENVQRAAESTEPMRTELRQLHRQLSHSLSADLASSVVLRNAKGERRSLPDLLRSRTRGARRLPGGVGDCAAPKLLLEAYSHGLRPTGLAEIWYEPPERRDGQEVLNAEVTRSTMRGRLLRGRAPRKKHGSFHEACTERCAPIMGFMLCGLDE